MVWALGTKLGDMTHVCVCVCRLGVEDAEHRLKFMSAGREDVDVRCLGDGRPFAIEVLTDQNNSPSTKTIEKVFVSTVFDSQK